MDQFLSDNIELLADVFWSQLGFSNLEPTVDTEYWAYSDMERAISSDVALAIAMIDALMTTAPSDVAVALAGAGPVAEAMALYDEVVGVVKDRARFDPRYDLAFRSAMSN